MKMFYLNVKKQEYGTVDIEPSLDEYYKRINCELITITNVQIYGQVYDVICDDEALLKDEQIQSILIMPGVSIYGNVLICKHNEYGYETGLTDDEVKVIQSCVYPMFVNHELLNVIVDDNMMGYIL